MAKILDNSVIMDKQYKMIELRKGFLINGQYYLKENMQPVPFNTVTYNNSSFTDSGRSLMSLNRNIKYFYNLSYGITNNTNNTICFDSKDETICYIVIEANSYKWLCKFREKDNRCELIKVVSIETSSGNEYSKILSIHEKDNEIRVCLGGPAVKTIIYSYSKEDLSIAKTLNPDDVSYNNSYAYDQSCQIYKDNEGYFMYKSGYGSNFYSFYNEVSNTKVVLTMNDVDPNYDSSSNYRNRFNYNNLYEKTDNSMSVIHIVANKKISGKCDFKAGYIVKYDKNANTISKEEIAITVESSITDAYSDGVYLASEYWSSDVWYKTIGRKKYTILYLRDAINIGKPSRAYFFEHKISEEDQTMTLHLVKIQEFPLGQTGNIIHYNDEERLRFYGYRRVDAKGSIFNNIYCYELDESRLEFVKTFNLDGEIKEFGFDLDRNLYVLWNNNEVSRYNERTVSNFNARFENGLYEYQGEDIQTNLIISTSNLEGKFIEKEVTLDLKGNAKFTSNGTKTITLTTSSESETKVPITITGAGALSIFPKVKL